MTSTPVIDLKYFQPVRHPSGDTQKETTNVFWQADIFTSHGLYAHSHISPLRCSLSRRPQCPKLYMPRSISLYGLCSTDIPSESPRYRSLSSRSTAEVVPHGHSRHSSKVKSRRRQRTAGLAHICRPCLFINCHGTNTLQQRTIRHRSTANCVCAGCHNYRPMPVDVSMGSFPPEQGSNQIAYASRSTRQHSHVHLHFRWHHARCKYPRLTPDRAGGLLYNGPRISGLRQTPHHISGSRFLCDSLKIQSQMPKNIFSSDRPYNRPPVRSNNYADRILFAQGLSQQAETRQILRCRNRQDSDFPDKQFHSTRTDYRTALPLPMAGRAFLQVDQAKPAHQELLWHLGKCRQNSNLDRCLSICPGCYTQKAAQYPGKSLHNSSNIERLDFRKNSVVTVTYGNSTNRENLEPPKPVGFIHLTVGHY